MSKNPEAKVKQQSVTAFFSKKPAQIPAETSTQVTRSPSIFAKFINIVRDLKAKELLTNFIKILLFLGERR